MRLDWELVVCGFRGHELVGTDAARVGPEHHVFARDLDGVRWYRCLRCDAWLPLAPPAEPTRDTPPARAEIELPLRGKALRDRVVLRLIALDRVVHVLVLLAVAVAVFLVAAHEMSLRREVFHIVNAVEGTSGNPTAHTHGLLHTFLHALTLRSSRLYAVAGAAAAYAVLEGAEAVGLWWQKRWAEYLTFVATCVFLPYEVYELARSLTPLKVVAFVINLAIAAYLLYAKRLFGLRGGAAAEERERAAEQGWSVLEQTAP